MKKREKEALSLEIRPGTAARGTNAVGMSISPPATTESEARGRSPIKH